MYFTTWSEILRRVLRVVTFAQLYVQLQLYTSDNGCMINSGIGSHHDTRCSKKSCLHIPAQSLPISYPSYNEMTNRKLEHTMQILMIRNNCLIIVSVTMVWKL
mgnify:CR=1 FL=1